MTFTKEQQDFIKDNIQGRTSKELTMLLNSTFGTSFDWEQIKHYKKNHRLVSGVRKQNAVHSDKFGAEFCEYIMSNAVGHSRKELSEMVKRDLGMDVSPKQIHTFLRNHRIRTGVDGRFKKGNVPYCKGMKGLHIPGSEKGWFKEGHEQTSALPIGSISRTQNGYLIKKISDTGGQWDQWKFLHRLVYEEAFGPIPKGHSIIFLDGNKENVDIENLKLVDNATNLTMIRNGLRFEDPELTEVGANIAALAVGIRKRKKNEKL